MADATPKRPAPKPSTAFPANVEPRGKTRFGPAPTTQKPPVQNIFNSDRHGKRPPMTPPRKVR